VLIDQGGIWFTGCEGVGSKGARRGFLLGGPRRLSAALAERIDYKLALLVYKCRLGVAPPYDMI